MYSYIDYYNITRNKYVYQKVFSRNLQLVDC